jgi:hypothetical protein
MHRGITPLWWKIWELAAETEGLDRLRVAIHSRKLQVIQKLAATCDKLEETTARAMIFGILFQMASDMIDTLRQDRDLNIGATGVFVVEFEAGGNSGDFAHGKDSWDMPDNLSGSVIGFGVEGPRCSHGRPFWQGVFLHGCVSF